jgi:hypothetical protein
VDILKAIWRPHIKTTKRRGLFSNYWISVKIQFRKLQMLDKEGQFVLCAFRGKNWVKDEKLKWLPQRNRSEP